MFSGTGRGPGETGLAGSAAFGALFDPDEEIVIGSTFGIEPGDHATV